MPYNQRLEAFLVEEEVTYGTDPTPTAGEGVRLVNRVWDSMSFEYAFPNKREDVVSNNLIKVAPGIPAGRIVNFDFAAQLIGAGAAYASGTPVRPDLDALLMACGMSRTHVDTGGSESVSYALADTGHKSCTVWAYAGGDLIKAVGCRGNWILETTAGQLAQIRFQLRGMLTTAPAETAVISATYDSIIPPAAKGIGLAIVPSGGGSWSPKSPTFSLTPGNQIVRLDDVNSADGIESFEIARREPRFTVTCRKPDLSDYTYWARSLSQVLHTIDATIGGTQYNRWDIDIDAGYLIGDPAVSDDQGFAAGTCEYELLDLILRAD